MNYGPTMLEMPLRILIVDDSAIFRRGLRMVLKSRPDWEVCGEAVDGVEAVEKAHKLNPDLVIMDFSMPRMTGLEAAREMLKEFPRVPILLLTLFLTGQLAEEASKVGIRASLQKNTMRSLMDGIDDILRRENLTV